MLLGELQHQLELAQLHRGVGAEHLHLLLLALGDHRKLVAVALAVIARGLRQLHRALHFDFGLDQFGLLIGRGLRLLGVDALLLRGLLLDEGLGELGGELFAPHRDQKFRRDGRFAEPHLADGDAGFAALGPDAALDLALDQRALVDQVEHLGRAVDRDDDRLAVRVEHRLAILIDLGSVTS